MLWVKYKLFEMPYRKRRVYRKRKPMYYRKRRYYRKKRRYYKKPRLTGMGTPSGMPTTRIASLRWCQEGSIQSASGAFSSRAYNANNIFDTNGSGGQPMGRDQWALLYNHYVVIGSKMRCYITATNTNTVGMTIGCQLNDDSTLTYTDIEGAIEARKGKFCQLGLPTGGGAKAKIGANFSAKKFFNVKNLKDNFDRLGGAIASNPNEDATFILWYQSMDGATTTNAQITVIIDYIVLFSEPQDLARS